MTRVVLPLLLGLAACAAPPTPPKLALDAPLVVPSNVCQARVAGQAVGARPTTIVFAPGLPHRVIRPGDPVTRDYRPERVNIAVDATGRVTRVFCG